MGDCVSYKLKVSVFEDASSKACAMQVNEESTWTFLFDVVNGAVEFAEGNVGAGVGSSWSKNYGFFIKFIQYLRK